MNQKIIHFHMIKHTRYPLPLLSKSLVQNVAWMILFFLPLFSLAQRGQVEAFFSPPEGWESGDMVELTIHYGSIDDPVYDITEAHFEVTLPEGATLSRESQPEFIGEDTWFGSDGNFYGTVETADDGRSFLVSLYRNDRDPVSGYGEVARVKGLIVEIGEIMMKGPGVPTIELAFDKHGPIDFQVNRNGLTMEILDAPEGTTFQVVDFSGRTVVAPTRETSFTLASRQTQLFVVHAKDETGRTGYKVIHWNP